MAHPNTLEKSVHKKTKAANRIPQKHTSREHSQIQWLSGNPGAARWATFLFKYIFRYAAYRFPLPITEYILYCDTFFQDSIYYYCPRCNITLERDYQAFCDRCGQKLDWRRIDKARHRFPER